MAQFYLGLTSNKGKKSLLSFALDYNETSNFVLLNPFCCQNIRLKVLMRRVKSLEQLIFDQFRLMNLSRLIWKNYYYSARLKSFHFWTSADWTGHEVVFVMFPGEQLRLAYWPPTPPQVVVLYPPHPSPVPACCFLSSLRSERRRARCKWPQQPFPVQAAEPSLCLRLCFYVCVWMLMLLVVPICCLTRRFHVSDVLLNDVTDFGSHHNRCALSL